MFDSRLTIRLPDSEVKLRRPGNRRLLPDTIIISVRQVAIAVTLALLQFGCGEEGAPGGHVFTVEGARTLLDGEPLLVTFRNPVNEN